MFVILNDVPSVFDNKARFESGKLSNQKKVSSTKHEGIVSKWKQENDQYLYRYIKELHKWRSYIRAEFSLFYVRECMYSLCATNLESNLNDNTAQVLNFVFCYLPYLLCNSGKCGH